MGFLVLTLLEFALVNSLARHQISIKRRQNALKDRTGDWERKKVAENAVSANMKNTKEPQVRWAFCSFVELCPCAMEQKVDKTVQGF